MEENAKRSPTADDCDRYLVAAAVGGAGDQRALSLGQADERSVRRNGRDIGIVDGERIAELVCPARIDRGRNGAFLADGERYVSGPQRIDLERSALRILKLMLDITK